MSESNGQPDLRVFGTGAVRTKDADGERYDLITPIGLEGVARIYAEGAEKYGDFNWEKGFSISDLVKHALRHWRLYASGDRSEDHLSKCAWGFLAAKHSEVMWPHLNTDLRREGCIPPTVDDETAASWDRFRENMARMKRDLQQAAKEPVPAAAPDIREGDRVTLDDGGFRVVRPSGKVPTKYHFMADPEADRLRMAQYRCDVRWEGHEVVTHWIDAPFSWKNDDLGSCDVAIVFPKQPGSWHTGLGWVSVAAIRGRGKKLIVVGPRPADFPQHESDEWYTSWEEFLRSLAPSRKESASAR